MIENDRAALLIPFVYAEEENVSETKILEVKRVLNAVGAVENTKGIRFEIGSLDAEILMWFLRDISDKLGLYKLV